MNQIFLVICPIIYIVSKTYRSYIQIVSISKTLAITIVYDLNHHCYTHLDPKHKHRCIISEYFCNQSIRYILYAMHTITIIRWISYQWEYSITNTTHNISIVIAMYIVPNHYTVSSSFAVHDIYNYPIKHLLHHYL